MSYYDDASLVLIPSGVKAAKVYSQKPTNGTGDLAFTRTGDTATRVNSAGLIEKVRTNLVLQSETFDNASWTKSLDGQVTITANAAVAPNGTTTADKIIPSAIAGFHCVQQQVTLSAGEASISVYAKAAENSFLQFFDALTTDYVNFNLTTGVVGSSDAYVGSIENAGSGWYRCKATKVVPSGTFSARIGVVTSATAARGESFTGNGTNGLLIWGAQQETGVATAYIPTTTAAVSVGPVANVPRLDYLGSTCPRLLLEPQRTNIQLNSEDFSQSNWSKTNSAVVTNQVASPDGYVNADKLNETAVNNIHQLESSRSVSSSTAYTMSVFAKKAERSWIRIYEDTTLNSAYFNLDSGTVGTVGGPTAVAKIENYGNGWYRCSVTYTETGAFGRYRITTAKQDNEASYLGVANNGIYVWGSQYEAGAYATSYIPTLGAAVTRGADAASKTGISSLIGQTEGAVYFEGTIEGLGATNRRIVSLSDGTNANTAVVLNALGTLNLEFALVTSSVTQASITASNAFTLGQTFKFAFAYANNDFVFYVNGVQIGVDGSGTLPASLTNLVFGRGPLDFLFEGKVAQALLFKTRLTNAQMQELTTL